MILDDFIVKLAEHLLVVVDKFEELSSNCSEIVLANGQARWNLKTIMVRLIALTFQADQLQ